MGGIIMNENIDLTKILEGCPKGTKFYHSIYGNIYFKYILDNSEYPIRLSKCNDGLGEESVTEKGIYHRNYDGECVLFPSKDQRDWSKFERFWDKPKVEKFDPKTLQPFNKVLVRGQNGQDWIAIFFSHIDNIFNMVVCGGQYWKQCIPYNHETKHLVGTNNDCPEYYKWWEE